MDQENPVEALTIPRSSIDDLLHDQAAALQQWFARGGQRIEDLIIRKFPAWLEPDRFLSVSAGESSDTARFRLMMCNKESLWRVTVDMVFRHESWLQEDGSIVERGVQFFVLNKDEQRVAVDCFAASLFPTNIPLTPEQTCLYWFRKLAKSHHINRIFAHKVFEAELD